MSAIAATWLSIQEKLKEIAPNRKIKVVAVAKHQSIETLKEAIDCGISCFGENYVQEGKIAMKELSSYKASWHFIGHIQSRKVKDLLDYDCVQSLARIEIAKSLSEKAVKQGKKIDVLIEVNIGEEPQKPGIYPLELSEFLSEISKMPGINPTGLMAMPPALQDLQVRRPYFKKLKALFTKYQSQYLLKDLSMGTSADYVIAVEEGATMVRLGEILLGKREY